MASGAGIAEVVARRYRTARKYGGYMPMADRDVPPGVPLRNYLHMVELSKGFAAGEDIDTFGPPCILEKQPGAIEEMFDLQKAIEAAEKGQRIHASSVHRWGSRTRDSQ